MEFTMTQRVQPDLLEAMKLAANEASSMLKKVSVNWKKV